MIRVMVFLCCVNNNTGGTLLGLTIERGLLAVYG